MGVNLGDVIIDGADIAGDGVNVASRLEAMAKPGGICVSAAIREQVRELLMCNSSTSASSTSRTSCDQYGSPGRTQRHVLDSATPCDAVVDNGAMALGRGELGDHCNRGRCLVPARATSNRQRHSSRLQCRWR